MTQLCFSFFPGELPEQAQSFWLSTHTVLWQLDEHHTVPDPLLLQIAPGHPEFVLYPEDGGYLGPGIVNDEGQGMFFFPW